MGCSPSKGNNFSTLANLRKGRMLPPVPLERSDVSQLENEICCNLTGSTNSDTKAKKPASHIKVAQKEAQLTPPKKKYVEQVNVGTISINKLEDHIMNNGTVCQQVAKTVNKQEVVNKKPIMKTKKNTKVPKKEYVDKDQPYTDKKVDFPESLVKAHQAAYTFLNPSIQKYDVLLEILEQATQTQISVQPMVAFMDLLYKEIIQGLEDIADKGEKVLKENEGHFSWPIQMDLSQSAFLNSGSANKQPPPDLLQQLLQYTTQRMINVSRTISRIGDTALEQAVEYFSSVSKILEEKLKVKRAVETRLMELLIHIEMASLSKLRPEDSALFSEDSGIGVENESLAGSEKCYRHENCGATGAHRTNMEYKSKTKTMVSKQRPRSQISPSVSLASLNSLGSTCTKLLNDQSDSLLGSIFFNDGDDDIDEEKLKKGVGDVKGIFKLQFNAPPVTTEKHSQCLPPKQRENPENFEMTHKEKNSIHGGIHFIPKQNLIVKAKAADNPKITRYECADNEKKSPKAASVQTPLVKKTPINRQQRSRSAESLRSKGGDHTLFELESTQKDLQKRLQKINKTNGGGNSRTTSFEKTEGKSSAQSPAINSTIPLLDKNNNSQSIKCKEDFQMCQNKKENQTSELGENKQKEKKMSKVPVKATQPPSPPLSPRPSSRLQRGRNSVKKLIDTFSQGLEDQESPKALELKGVRRCGVPVLPGLGNVEAVLNSGITSCRPEQTTSEKTQYLDVSGLPPPPQEVLKDKSFQSILSRSNEVENVATKVEKSPVLKRAAVPQGLRTLVQSGRVLPSKRGLPQSFKFVGQMRLAQQDTTTSLKSTQSDVQPGAKPATEADSLNQQARMIIHLHKSSDCNAESSSTNFATVNSQYSNLLVAGSNTTESVVPHCSVMTNQQPTTPLVSRVRILPLTPCTSSSLHQRLCSPNGLNKEMAPASTAFPVKTFSTPPPVQRRLPSPPATKTNVLNSNSLSTHSFKALSPPASPKVQRWSRENSSEEASSARMFSNAHSVFCPVSPSMFKAQSCSAPARVSFVSTSWGNKGRFSASVQGPRLYLQQSQSDRRASLCLPSRPQHSSLTVTCGSEPGICSQVIDDEPTRDVELWGSQSDLRAPSRSASHPDLCIVGQAFQRD